VQQVIERAAGDDPDRRVRALGQPLHAVADLRRGVYGLGIARDVDERTVEVEHRDEARPPSGGAHVVDTQIFQILDPGSRNYTRHVEPTASIA
jgi:hypothetical protein